MSEVLGSKPNIENGVVTDARFEFSYPKRSTDLRFSLHRIGPIRRDFCRAGTNRLIVQVLPAGKPTGDGSKARETRDRDSARGRKSFSRRGNDGTARGLFVPLRSGPGSFPARLHIRGAAVQRWGRQPPPGSPGMGAIEQAIRYVPGWSPRLIRQRERRGHQPRVLAGTDGGAFPPNPGRAPFRLGLLVVLC